MCKFALELKQKNQQQSKTLLTVLFYKNYVIGWFNLIGETKIGEGINFCIS